MPRRLVPAILAALALTAAVILAELGGGFDTASGSARAHAVAEQDPPQAPAEPDPDPDPDPSAEPELPPDHPPIDRSAMAQPSAEEPLDIGWTKPPEWQEAPNPNPVRLATYRAPGGAEMSVARAGGSTEANIRRWIGQFENAGASTPESKVVHGLRVTTVRVTGTYAGSMGMGSEAPEAHPDWALLGAVVETTASPYFFKLVGPAPSVKAARPAFERLVASIAPR